jgi:hypothetical protein
VCDGHAAAAAAPRYSGRLPALFEPNALARLLAERRRAGARVIDLTETNPTRVGLSPPDDETAAALARGAARSDGYTPNPRGLAAARAAVAAYHAERAGVAGPRVGGGIGADIDPDRIVLTASTSEAYAHVFRLLGDPGDAFLVPRPSYPLLEPLAALEGVRLAAYALEYDGRWTIDPERAARLAGARTRGLVVVHPNNPTGSFVAPGEAAALESLCAERGLALIADEVFADFAWESAGPRRGTFAGPSRALTFTLSGLSKVAGLPHLKLGWIAVSGPDALVGAAVERLEWIADAFLSVGSPVQHALPELLAARGAYQARTRARLAENRARLAACLASCDDVEVLSGEGGWSAVVRVPRTRGEDVWALELLRRDVLVHPGHFYDFPDEAYLVVSLLPRPTEFAEGVDRFAALAREEPRTGG